MIVPFYIVLNILDFLDIRDVLDFFPLSKSECSFIDMGKIIYFKAISERIILRSTEYNIKRDIAYDDFDVNVENILNMINGCSDFFITGDFVFKYFYGLPKPYFTHNLDIYVLYNPDKHAYDNLLKNLCKLYKFNYVDLILDQYCHRSYICATFNFIKLGSPCVRFIFTTSKTVTEILSTIHFSLNKCGIYMNKLCYSHDAELTRNSKSSYHYGRNIMSENHDRDYGIENYNNYKSSDYYRIHHMDHNARLRINLFDNLHKLNFKSIAHPIYFNTVISQFHIIDIEKFVITDGLNFRIINNKELYLVYPTNIQYLFCSTGIKFKLNAIYDKYTIISDSVWCTFIVNDADAIHNTISHISDKMNCIHMGLYVVNKKRIDINCLDFSIDRVFIGKAFDINLAFHLSFNNIYISISI